MKNVPYISGEPVEAFAQRFHFGVQGITATSAETEQAITSLVKTGWTVRAFDTELSYVDLVSGLLPDGQPIHVPISYPMGNTTTALKMSEIEQALGKNVFDVCVAIDYRAALSGRWQDIEQSVAEIEKAFGAEFDVPDRYLAHIIPGEILPNEGIIAACQAVADAGGCVIKVNPGARLNVSPDQIGLILDYFGLDRFDVHPSGGIRDMEAALTYLEMGCTTIHTRAALEIIENYASEIGARRS